MTEIQNLQLAIATDRTVKFKYYFLAEDSSEFPT